MKRNTITVVVGVLLLLIFVLLLFTFQVRQTEVAVVTTFDRPTRVIPEPGLYWKWPPPIQKVYAFDRRVHSFEGRFEQTLTKDNYPLLAMVYVGWTIDNPMNFFSSFSTGKASDAEPALSALIENGKNEVIGKHTFSDFVSTDPTKTKFEEVEKQILESIAPVAKKQYGIDIRFVGIKKLGLPESVTEKVFARMQAEREREAAALKAQGESRAIEIRSQAELERDNMLAAARGKATQIRGEADAEAQKALTVLAQNPQLAVFLEKLKSLEQSLKDKTTLILDDRTPPYDLLTQPMDFLGKQSSPTQQQPSAPGVTATKPVLGKPSQ